MAWGASSDGIFPRRRRAATLAHGSGCRFCLSGSIALLWHRVAPQGDAGSFGALRHHSPRLVLAASPPRPAALHLFALLHDGRRARVAATSSTATRTRPSVGIVVRIPQNDDAAIVAVGQAERAGVRGNARTSAPQQMDPVCNLVSRGDTHVLTVLDDHDSTLRSYQVDPRIPAPRNRHVRAGCCGMRDQLVPHIQDLLLARVATHRAPEGIPTARDEALDALWRLRIARRWRVRVRV
mmetsp:Transcript_18852/g.60096  ORF Transcript_18852/g.60096 Transcript_18852/m.60096 type:complete len:238 (-) Transcript_18852:337-1050(-)